jgi:acetyl esterase
MHVDPPLVALFEQIGPTGPPPVDLAARRAQANDGMKLLKVPEVGASVEDVEVSEHVRVRVIRPVGTDGLLPGLLFIHGGGWFQGDLDTAEVECGPMATAVGCVVVSVQYRLAPEHPFPAPLDDCVTAWVWLHDNAPALGIDSSRVAVAGTSAGGNLAAALCLVARDRGLPMPAAQLLDVPATDLTAGSPSLKEYDGSAGLTASQVEQFAAWYAGDTPLDHPYVSPLLAPDLSGLPPAVVVVAEHDPVRDDGERWVEALQKAGVPAMGVRVLAQLHGTWIIPLTVTSRLVQDLRASALRRAFEGTLVP